MKLQEIKTYLVTDIEDLGYTLNDALEVRVLLDNPFYLAECVDSEFSLELGSGSTPEDATLKLVKVIIADMEDEQRYLKEGKIGAYAYKMLERHEKMFKRL